MDFGSRLNAVDNSFGELDVTGLGLDTLLHKYKTARFRTVRRPQDSQLLARLAVCRCPLMSACQQDKIETLLGAPCLKAPIKLLFAT